MALNLEKKKITEDYYYSENGNTVGPFPISELLTKITPDTLVYKDGISWTIAKEIPELSKHFKLTEKKNTQFKNEGKNKALYIIIGVAILIVISTFLFLSKNDNKENVTINETSKDSIDNLKIKISTEIKSNHLSSEKPTIQTENNTPNISEQNKENVKIDNQIINSEDQNLTLSNFQKLNSETERQNYFNNNLYPKRDVIKKNGGKKLENYKEAVKKSYSDLVVLFNETTDQNKINELCNLRQDLEDELKDLNCEVNKEIQKKLKEICF